MTYLMRLLIISVLTVGTCSYVRAQDDLDSLLDGVGGDEEIVQEETTSNDAVAEAEPEEVIEEATAEEATAEEATPPATVPEATTEDVAAQDEAVEEKPAVAAEGPTAEAEENKPEPTPAETPAVAPAETPAVTVEAQPTEQDRIAAELFELEAGRQKLLDEHGKMCLDAARKLMFEGRFMEAHAKFKEADEYIRNREDTVSLHEEARIGMRNAWFEEGKRLHKIDAEKDPEHNKKAIDALQKAQNLDHPQAKRLIEVINAEANRPVQPVVKSQLPAYAETEYKATRTQIRDRMKKATTYYNVGNYKAAQEQVEMVLRDDAQNEYAIDLRGRIARRRNHLNEVNKRTTHDSMIDQVNANWTPRGYYANESDELNGRSIGAPNAAVNSAEATAKAERRRVEEKLDYIVIPEISLKPPSTLADAIDLFNDLSQTYDKPDLPPEQKGISFVLNIPTAKAVGGEEEGDAFSGGGDSGLPPIQAIKLNFVTLKVALDTVCDVTGTKYDIKGKVVTITPASSITGRMETRSYNVMSSFAEKVNTLSDESQSGGGFGGGESEGGAESDKWKKLFTDYGVPFDANSKIAYLPTVGKLRVTNTPENLAIFEQVLEEINVTPFQIEVETRFVEVSQTDLNSLGFEWILNQNYTTKIGSGLNWSDAFIQGNSYGGNTAGGESSLLAGNGIFKNPALNSVGNTGMDNFGIHGGQGTVNQGMRFLGNAAENANRVNLSGSALAVDDQFAKFSGVFGNFDISMILHMLSQRTDTDMLSSPKVLARPGQEAMIKVVTEWIYPTEFSIRELDVNNNNNNNNNGSSSSVSVPFAVEPQNFEMRETGVILSVIPDVSAEGQMINLTMQPSVVEWLEDFDYGMSYYASLPSGTSILNGQLIENFELKEISLKMPQPKFHTRSLSTMLSVYNGATVVMGGLITESRRSIDDKVPILGDLPFIGFLFRSKADFSEKRNLLIFVTARLVDPAGRPLRTATDGRDDSTRYQPQEGVAPTAPASLDAAMN